MQNRNVVRYTILDGKSGNGVWDAKLLPDFRHAVVCISTSGSAALTLKCQWAIKKPTQDTAPDFSDTASATNRRGYIQMIDLDNGDPVDGSTGIVFAGTDSVKLYEVNTNLLDFISFQVTGHSAGSVNVDLILSNNS